MGVDVGSGPLGGFLGRADVGHELIKERLLLVHLELDGQKVFVNLSECFFVLRQVLVRSQRDLDVRDGLRCLLERADGELDCLESEKTSRRFEGGGSSISARLSGSFQPCLKLQTYLST